MKIRAKYPTTEHQKAAEATMSFFAGQPGVESVNLTCSCARGKASRDSCVDIAVLISPNLTEECRSALEERWNDFYKSEGVFHTLHQVGAFSHVDLEFVNGEFTIP